VRAVRTFTIILLLVLSGCGSVRPEPRIPLANIRLAEGPVLIQRGERYYLRYRRDIANQPMPLYVAVERRKEADAAYFFFTIALSRPEWGAVYEWPLATEPYETFARGGRIFWLDPDGTKHPIPVRRESP
jgi:hypothetical protein